MAKALPFSMLGLSVSGDLGDMTLYQDRQRRVIAYPRHPPECPKTPAQARQRSLFGQAVASWRATTDQVREDYETISLRCNLQATGHNVWVSFAFSQNREQLDTLCRQAQLDPATVPLPPVLVPP